MHDYIPGGEANKVEWIGKFAGWFGAHGTSKGFTSAEVAEYVALAAAAPEEQLNCMAAHDAARAATAQKKEVINRAVRRAREIAQRLQKYPDMTDPDRAAAGLRIPDRNPTPTDPENIFHILPPLLLLNFGIRGRVTIHWGPNPANEQRNGQPDGTRGCQIQAAIGGIPENDSGWIDLGLCPRSPFHHHVEITTPITYIYRARYIGINLKYGPFGAPISCTVSV